jgi:hypothetical protein
MEAADPTSQSLHPQDRDPRRARQRKLTRSWNLPEMSMKILCTTAT